MPRDWNQTLQEANDNFTTVFEYDGNNNPIYIGRAYLGSLKANPVWQIRKLTYSGTNLTDVQWAQGSDRYAYIWDNRAGYTYS